MGPSKDSADAPVEDVVDDALYAAGEQGLEADEPEAGVRSYLQIVTEQFRACAGKADEVAAWYSTRGEKCDLEEHLSRIYTASGLTDLPGRLELVKAAMYRQQQLVQERRSRKRQKDRLRDAAGAVVKALQDEEEFGISAPVLGPAMERLSSKPRPPASAQPPTSEPDRVSRSAPTSGAGREVDPSSSGRAATAQPGSRPVREAANPEPPNSAGTDGSGEWSRVRDFKTMEEALRFVMECQPIDYRPVNPLGMEIPFPRYESTRDAFEHVRNMVPIPSEFVSADGDFHRRLRIRRLEAREMREMAAPVAAVRRGRAGKSTNSEKKGDRFSTVLHAVQELRPFLVEASGTLFARPPSLRALHRDVGARYFIAVTPEVEKKVLVEGFRVQRRCSIPCSATPKEALAAFTSHEQKAGRPVSGRAAVLVVNLPPESGIDVVAHKNGGFLIRCSELPASYFGRVRRIGGGDGG